MVLAASGAKLSWWRRGVVNGVEDESFVNYSNLVEGEAESLF